MAARERLHQALRIRARIRVAQPGEHGHGLLGRCHRVRQAVEVRVRRRDLRRERLGALRRERPADRERLFRRVHGRGPLAACLEVRDEVCEPHRQQRQRKVRPGLGDLPADRDPGLAGCEAVGRTADRVEGDGEDVERLRTFERVRVARLRAQALERGHGVVRGVLRGQEPAGAGAAGVARGAGRDHGQLAERDALLRQAVGDGGRELGVASATATGSRTSGRTHTVRLTLTPVRVDADGERRDVLVASDVETRD